MPPRFAGFIRPARDPDDKRIFLHVEIRQRNELVPGDARREKLAQVMQPEARYYLLSAMANQLRYPNSHTYFFSFTILRLFGIDFSESDDSDIRQQIIRVLLERLIVRRFYAAPIVAMLGTYALGLIIRESVRGLIGGLYISVPEPIGGSLNIGAMHFLTWRLVIILITTMVMVASYWLLARTPLGLRIRASLENPPLARASGISTNAIYGATFAFGAALAGLAGALIVPVFSLFADLGLRFLIQGFVAVMVGGVGSFAGPVAGAGVIGTLAAALPWVIQPVIADVLVFVLAIAFIKFRPQGLVSGKGV